MHLSVFEADLLIDALTARAARYESMAADEGISMRALNRYEIRRDAMRALRDRLRAVKIGNGAMALELPA